MTLGDGAEGGDVRVGGLIYEVYQAIILHICICGNVIAKLSPMSLNIQFVCFDGTP